MINKFHTERLSLIPLNVDDASFIFQLVNTKGWIQFIGDRNILNVGLSKMYIQQLFRISQQTLLILFLRKEHTVQSLHKHMEDHSTIILVLLILPI